MALNETDNTIGKVAVYKLTKERTEADLQLASVTTEEFTEATKQTITLAKDNNSFTFTPANTDVTYFAIQYLAEAADATKNKKAVYTYKVVKVEAAPATK